MGALQDPRVRHDPSVTDQMYEVTTPDGTWDVIQDEDGLFISVAPPGLPESFVDSSAGAADRPRWIAWLAQQPRFVTAEEAVANILDRY